MKNPFENFGCHLFSESVMKESLPYPVFNKWKTSINKEDALDRNTADEIAHAMKTWALNQGVTHFTHWFQPMTGSTAEKHDSFIEPNEQGQPITRFSGKALIKGETDGSSFPNGGLRATFEARGYTYWDATSPAFIKDNILCIPTIFVSYSGETLDKKAPLLKSLEALSKQATRIVNIFGDKDVKMVHAMAGLEQEYFLINREHFKTRSDLFLTGRTLFGALPAKGQELSDHYFGSIPEKVSRFMKDVNEELWNLGIYSKAEHNEVAPGQFELAPLYTHTNIAVDQNQLIMDVLKKTAKKHDMECLLHEKPFKGVNGSGKHNNWSLISDDGQNLLEPGDRPHENMRFLIFICAVMQAVDSYPELLKMAASGPGNDHRLGTSEAPPAIISMFMGSWLEELLFQISEGQLMDFNATNRMTPISTLSYMPKDTSDRNRTSPFAFTGNKFEYRMVGSSRSASTTNIILNTIVADSLEQIAQQLENYKYKQDIREAALSICKKIVKKHQRILFSGDGYSADWIIEAKKRGLANIPSFVESIDSLIEQKSIDLFEHHQVFRANELAARAEILHEQYVKTMQVEIKTLLEMANKQIIPALVDEIRFYSESYQALNKTNNFYVNKIQIESDLLLALDDSLKQLQNLYNQASLKTDYRSRGLFIRANIFKAMEDTRQILDQIEENMSDRFWPIPTYKEMLYSLD